MLKYGNRDFRNLQEQVYANMKNIQDIIDGSSIIADLNTLHIVGTADTALELPDPDTYVGKYGDAIAVGTKEPYDLYVFTKAYENQNAPQWFNLGNFPQPGPQGPQGPKGDTGMGVPAIKAGDAGKALLVNSEDTAAEWTELPSGLPEIKSGDAGKLLAVNAGETGSEWKTDNNLKLPQSSPATQQLVGINTSGAQNAILIGDKLRLENGELNGNYLVLDYNNKVGLGIIITEDIYTNITNQVYSYIQINNYYISNPSQKFTLTLVPDKSTNLSNGLYAALNNQFNYAVADSGVNYTVMQFTINLIGAEGQRQAQITMVSREVSDSKYGNMVLQGTSGTFDRTALNELYRYNHITYYYRPNGSPNFPKADVPITFYTYEPNGGSKYYIGKGEVYDEHHVLKKILYITFLKQGRAWTLTEVDPGSESVVDLGEHPIYTTSAATVSLGSHHVWMDLDRNKMFIKINSGTEFDVLDQQDAVINVSNKSIVDYKTHQSPVIKLMVNTDNTNYYLDGGLYEPLTITLGFAKPTSTVGAIAFKVKITNNSTDYYLSPDILYAGNSLIGSLPVQYNGINRDSITSISATGGVFVKFIGTEITFGADANADLSMYLDNNIVKNIVVI